MRIQDPDPHQNWMDPKHWTCEFSDDFDIVFLDDFWFCMVMPNRKALIRLLGFRICCFYVFIAYKLEGPELPVKKILSLEHPLANYESPQQISAHSVQPFVRLQGIYININVLFYYIDCIVLNNIRNSCLQTQYSWFLFTVQCFSWRNVTEHHTTFCRNKIYSSRRNIIFTFVIR